MRGKACALALSLGVLFAAAGAAFGGESASATINVDSLAGPTYNYTITLTDTGTTNIGSFWYGWVPEPDYDFLASQPTVTSSPAGWVAPVEGAGDGYDGYSVEWYNLTGNAITPGNSATFKFSSTDSPSVLGGPNMTYYATYISPLPMQTSYVYAGFPESDAGYTFALPTPTLVSSPAPEPASLVVLGIGAAALIARRRAKAGPRRA